ncbi:MAG: hypothetical protein M3Y66_08325, partial [Actinomycetota bacterium]|nr:hypothetical protein [Actinomycetota bacterium]
AVIEIDESPASAEEETTGAPVETAITEALVAYGHADETPVPDVVAEAAAEPREDSEVPAAAPVIDTVPADSDPSPATPKQHPSRVRGLLARLGLSREEDAVAADAHADVPAQDVPAQDVSEPTSVLQTAADDERARPAYDPDATEHYDWTIAEFDEPQAASIAEAPAEAPAEDTAAAAAAEVETQAEQWSDADDQDHQEWFDDNGLRWTSDDGGYTWFSSDGQGWNAEIGEPIEVPVVPSSATAVIPPAVVDAPIAQAPESAAPVESKDDVWPTQAIPAAAGTSTPYWPDVQESDADIETGSVPAATTPPEPETSADQSGAHETELPQYVEYKPRGAYRPLLGVLFVAAAVLAVAAIFWAVSKGSQAAIGIAVGVTGFALAFWWGLLSWTPTVVSVSGPMLEVARGSDGERFDLSSPHLKIDLDDDTSSRNWRTTITRPNGTELVIPASAVDTEEFSAIVRHYRDEAARS